MKPNHVVCAIDIHDYDQEVVDLSAEFAKQFGVHLDLVFVTIVPEATKSAWPAYLGAPDELTRDNRLLRKLEPNVEGVDVRHHHLSGMPVTQIVDFVDRNPPRLLVLGTHARRGMSRILGSVAAKILRRVSCPVLVFRQRQNSQSYDGANQETKAQTRA